MFTTTIDDIAHNNGVVVLRIYADRFKSKYLLRASITQRNQCDKTVRLRTVLGDTATAWTVVTRSSGVLARVEGGKNLLLIGQTGPPEMKRRILIGSIGTPNFAMRNVS